MNLHSDYAAKVFGFATFGKVYGLIICLAGLLNFSQTALDALTHRAFNNNPIPVNVMLLSLALVIGVALVGFVWSKSRQGVLREGLESEAAGARESLMPNASMNGVGVSDYGALNGSASNEERGRSRV
jgi:multisubunit Na+/H+ antiporter MnhC subunit